MVDKHSRVYTALQACGIDGVAGAVLKVKKEGFDWLWRVPNLGDQGIRAILVIVYRELI